MSSDARWQRLERVFHDALALDTDARVDFVTRECHDDPSLRDEVLALLGAHARPGLVDELGQRMPSVASVLDGPAPTMAGRTVGHYRLMERVGGGGMGIVYKALDVRLGRTVALKFLRQVFDADERSAERFRIEARAVAALDHPNVCTVHEIGETADGQLYLAMPLYSGETLQRRIAHGPLPVADAAAIALQVARALSVTHARRIVHRDIKPSNIFITDDGVVKLLDFGIAKLADITLTGHPGPIGTIAYMSPEQATGDAVDHRTDLWSLGVILAEMLTGTNPFVGSGERNSLLTAIERMRQPVSLPAERVPDGLRRIIARALSVDPDTRYQQADEFAHDLTALGFTVHGDTSGAPFLASVDARRARRAAFRWRWTAAVAGLVLLAVTGVAIWQTRSRATGGDVGVRAAGPGADDVATIAVLPFADRSPAGDQEYFSDGITEELIATLARVDGLRVASRTSAFAFKGREMDIREIGRELGVGMVLEGSVRRAGNRLRITAQLVKVADGYPLWSETFDRGAQDAFAVQQEIARAIANTLQVTLVGPGHSLPEGAPDSAAYDAYLRGRQALYLKGRYAWYTRTEEGLRSAAQFFEEATKQSPAYARAHAGLADAYAVLGFYDYLPPHEAFPRAAAAAQRAVDLDPLLGGPHATLGYVALYYDWNFQRSEEEFRRAIALEPNYSTAHQWYANMLTAAGRFPEALGEMRRAGEIDPLSLIANAALGWVMYHAGDYKGAAAQCQQTLELNANYGLALLWRGWALQELDSLPAAVEAHRRALAVSDSGGLYMTSLARSLALAGDSTQARAMLARLLARRRGAYLPAYEIAKVHAALGESDRAFDWLERARDARAHSLALIRVDPQLASLRGDPRFGRLVASLEPR